MASDPLAHENAEQPEFGRGPVLAISGELGASGGAHHCCPTFRIRLAYRWRTHIECASQVYALALGPASRQTVVSQKAQRGCGRGRVLGKASSRLSWVEQFCAMRGRISMASWREI